MASVSHDRLKVACLSRSFCPVNAWPVFESLRLPCFSSLERTYDYLPSCLCDLDGAPFYLISHFLLSLPLNPRGLSSWGSQGKFPSFPCLLLCSSSSPIPLFCLQPLPLSLHQDDLSCLSLSCCASPASGELSECRSVQIEGKTGGRTLGPSWTWLMWCDERPWLPEGWKADVDELGCTVHAPPSAGHYLA